jgi:surface polysaccharide O-acyltransferase-like enzyme
MSELILFTLNAIVVYLLADWLVRMIEQRRSSALKQRQVVFFAIFLALVLTSFAILRKLLEPG